MKTLITRRSWGRRTASAVALSLAGVLTIAGCAAGGEAAQPNETGPQVGMIGETNDGTPTSGGTLTFAPYAMVTSLDPLRTQASGATGGTEMASVYDVLIRVDTETNEFVPQLAESLAASDDQMQWTLKLRPGVTFSDGTPLDADAVVWSINRFNVNRGVGSELWLKGVTSTTAVDRETVVFALNAPWSSFPAMLATAHGMIVALSSESGTDFVPIGAGPYKVASFAPNEELAMTSRSDYWDGAPNLDGIRFVQVKGDQAKVDSLVANSIDVGFLLQPKTVQQALDAGLNGYVNMPSLGTVALINNRPGRPGEDIRVRQAMAHAVDADAFDSRVNDGMGMSGSEIFPSWSAWSNDVEPLTYDPDRARKLLEEAKSGGYDGTLVIVAMNEPVSQTQALTLQAMLNAVGFNAEIEYANSSTDLMKRRFVDHDFDLAYGGISLYEVAPSIRLNGALHSDSSNNALGYRNEVMDALLRDLQAADGAENQAAVLVKIQEHVNETVPFLTLGSSPMFVAWGPDVHGIMPSIDSFVLLGDAWINR